MSAESAGTGLVARLRLMADQGDYGRKPDPQDIRRLAAARIEALERERDALERRIKVQNRSALNTRSFWVRAAKAAMAGDFRELRNRVDLCEAPPVEIVLSEALAPTAGREHAA